MVTDLQARLRTFADQAKNGIDIIGEVLAVWNDYPETHPQWQRIVVRQMAADIGEAADHIDTLSARIQELEGAPRQFAAHGNATSDYVGVPTRWFRAAASILAKMGEPQEHSRAATDVLDERRRQIEAEGWTAEHDDSHSNGELAAAASCYAYPNASVRKLVSSRWDAGRSLDDDDIPVGRTNVPANWPDWDGDWWKPSDRRRNLVKAGALILAEIERLDRSALGRNAG